MTFGKKFWGAVDKLGIEDIDSYDEFMDRAAKKAPDFVNEIDDEIWAEWRARRRAGPEIDLDKLKKYLKPPPEETDLRAALAKKLKQLRSK